MKRSRVHRKEMGFQSISTSGTLDELVFNLLKFGAFVLIVTFGYLILLMGGVH